MKLTMSIKELCFINQTEAGMFVRPRTAFKNFENFSKRQFFQAVRHNIHYIPAKDMILRRRTHIKRLIVWYIINFLPLLLKVPCEIICVWSPDTDVHLLLIYLVSCERISGPIPEVFHRKWNKEWKIAIFNRVQVIGPHKCHGLLGIHNFSGADWEENLKLGIYKNK